MNRTFNAGLLAGLGPVVALLVISRAADAGRKREWLGESQGRNMSESKRKTIGQDPLAFLAGGGEMGRLVRAFDWSKNHAATGRPVGRCNEVMVARREPG